MWNEALVNQREMEIDELATCMRRGFFQPMARDLRFITAVIKINSDLERMGDLAVNITERALSLMRVSPLRPLVDIPRIAELAVGEGMVHRMRWTRSRTATPIWPARCCWPTTR